MKAAPAFAALALLLSVQAYACSFKADVQLGRDPSSAIGGWGGAANPEPSLPSFLLGADISTLQEELLPLIDTDGHEKEIFALLEGHGFNAIRLRTFVDPNAPFGYASDENECPGRPEAFGDQAHVIAYAKLAKERGMSVFVDFHYSDTWADGDSQIVPSAWRGEPDVEALAVRVKDYTKSFLAAAIAEGARPNLVQIGNGITSGFLLHVPSAETDCFGDDVDPAKVNGSVSERGHFDALLRAASEGVRETDPNILIALHAGNPNSATEVVSWVGRVIEGGVDFDAFGMSCFTSLQGPPDAWRDTYVALAENYPDLKLIVAEYKGDPIGVNEVIMKLPEGNGLGTFYWEPTLSGDFGTALFSRDGEALRADAEGFAEFDALREALDQK